MANSLAQTECRENKRTNCSDSRLPSRYNPYPQPAQSLPQNVDVAVQYQQRLFNEKYGHLFHIKGCQQNPDLCFIVMSNFRKTCSWAPERGLYSPHALSVLEIIPRVEGGQSIAYVVLHPHSSHPTPLRVQAEREMPWGTNFISECYYTMPISNGG